jgi:death-on-curing protein
VTLCDINGWWIDAEENEALDLVRNVGRGLSDLHASADCLRGWASPKAD